MNYFFLVASLVFGSVIGSFLNVLILRLPNEQEMGGRSHCPNCHHILGVLDLFPIVSYVALLGHCRYCGKKISPRYVIVEITTAVLFALSWQVLEPASLLGLMLLIKYWLAASTLIIVFAIDWEHYIILDSVIFKVLFVMLLLNTAQDAILGSWHLNLSSVFISGLVGAVAAFLPFFLLWYFSKGEWLGFGDVKLSLLLGIILGWPQVYVSYFLSVMLGGAVSAALLIFTRNTLKSRLPFGTFLAVGTFISLLYGRSLLHWYMAFLGF